MVKIIRVSFRLLAISILIVCANLAFGQATQISTIGLPPNGVFDSTGFDSVNLNSGNLHIDIPLLDRKERGGVDNSLRLVYDSADWELDTICGFDGWCTQETVPGPAMQWNLVSSSGYSIDLTNGPCEGFAQGDPGYLWESYFITVIDGNNTQHTMIPNPTMSEFMDVYTPTVVNQHGFCQAYFDTKIVYAQDGSGITYYTGYTPNGPNNFTGPTPSNFHGSAGTLDTNGNGHPPGFVFPEYPDTIGVQGYYSISYPNGLYNQPPYTQASEVDITYKDSNGASQAIRLTYAQQATTHASMGINYWNSVNGDPVGAPPDPPGFAGNINLLQSIQFPNGTSYSFTYDPNDGWITSAALPTGGTIQWDCGGHPPTTPNDFSIGQPSTPCRMLDNDPTRKWTYALGQGGGYTIDPLGTKKSYSFDWFSGNMLSETIADSTGRIIQTTNNIQGYPSFIQANGLRDFNANYYTSDKKILESDISVALAGQSVSASSPTYAITTDYDGIIIGYPNDSLDVPVPLNQVTSRAVYDFGAGAHGALLKQETFTYDHIANTGILDRPLTHIITGPGNYFSETWEYDNYGASGLTSTSGVPAHDYTHWSATSSYPRGNVTKHSVWNSSQNTWLSTTYAYDDLGNILTSTDPRGNTTSFSYNDVSDGVCTPPTNSHAYLTQTTNALGHRGKSQYNYCTGLVTEVWDENELQAGVDGTKTHYDLMRNVTQVLGPVVPLPSQPGSNGQSTTTIDYGSYAVPLVITKTETATPSPAVISVAKYDDFGRPTQTKVNPNGPGSSVTTAVTYDQLGRKSFVPYPYVSTQGAGEQYNYDALDRMTSIHHTSDQNSQSWLYSGNTVTFTDEVGNAWTRASDAVGRLTSVTEPNALATTYSYDALGNLTGVNQPGISGQEIARMRSFSYDSLSRLLWSKNPETGVMCYGQGDGTVAGCQKNGYDANGNLLHKTDARGSGITYAYDVLNRLTAKTYTDGVTPSVTFDYDQTGSWSGVPLQNTVGRLWHSATGAGTSKWTEMLYSYDAMGRPTEVEYAPPSEAGTTFHTATTGYDLAGNVTDRTYPDNSQVAQGFDGAGRLAWVKRGTSQNPGTPYVSSIVYLPDGSPATIVYGDGSTGGATEHVAENSRLQPCEISALMVPAMGGSMFIDRQYRYGQTPENNCGTATGNNGNIWSIVDATNVAQNSNARNQTFGYDSLNRLTSWSTPSMGGQSRSQTFNYDSFGNISQTAGGNMPNFAPGYDAKNHILASSFNCSAAAGTVGADPSNPGYDLAGNVVCSGVQNVNAQAYVYDAESRVTQTASQMMNNTYALSGSYSYDGGGDRIRKDVAPFGNQAFTEYTYFGGQMLSEKDQTGAWTDYIYANGKKIAKVDSQKPILHNHGYRDGSNSGCGAEGPVSGVPSGVVGVVIATGDRMMMDMQQSLPTYGGLALIFTNNTGTGAMNDMGSGQPFYFNGFSDGQWHHFVGDLTPYVGLTVSYVLAGLHLGIPNGTFDTWTTNAVISHADGSVSPILIGQSASVPNLMGNSCGGQQMTSLTESTITTDPAVSTNYYIDDHLGSTQIELSAGGWPTWEGQFTPFGQEIVGGTPPSLGAQPSDGTAMRYKFTGKERDAESGLDYFGARYYASNMGRWMSPDWAAKPEAVPYSSLDNPQSLNLYGYVLNNPLSKADPDGHCGGPGDPCGDIKVSVTHDSPGSMLNFPLSKKGPYFTGIASTLTITFKNGQGQPLSGLKVGESNTTSAGKPVQNPDKITTSPSGTMKDIVGQGPTTPTPSMTQSGLEHVEDVLTSSPLTRTSTQTLTFGVTDANGNPTACQTSYSRTITNTDSSGNLSTGSNLYGNNFTVTTTQPSKPIPVPDKKP